MSETARVVDARDMNATEVFAAFDSLEIGGAAVFVTDRNPRPLLLEFQANRAGSFEWSVLEGGPTRFRVEIRRRPSAATRTVSDYLQFDHRRLDAMLPTVVELLGTGAFGGAADQFADFACGLNRHIEAEERVLFPAFEERTGMRTGPTVVMRAEHVEIREWMALVETSLKAQDDAGARHALTRLTATLSAHNMKEELMLYPMIDQAADGSERDALVRQMQAL